MLSSIAMAVNMVRRTLWRMGGWKNVHNGILCGVGPMYLVRLLFWDFISTCSFIF